MVRKAIKYINRYKKMKNRSLRTSELLYYICFGLLILITLLALNYI